MADQKGFQPDHNGLEPQPEIVLLTQRDERYETVIGHLRDNAELLRVMWEHGGHRFDEHPDREWMVALDQDGTAMAWVTAIPTGTPAAPAYQWQLGFVRPEYRDRTPYPAIVAAMHAHTQHARGLTYVYEYPKPLMEELGWRVTDSRPIKGRKRERWYRRRERWYEMTWTPGITE